MKYMSLRHGRKVKVLVSSCSIRKILDVKNRSVQACFYNSPVALLRDPIVSAFDYSRLYGRLDN